MECGQPEFLRHTQKIINVEAQNISCFERSLPLYSVNLIYHFTRTKLKYGEFLLSKKKVALSPFTIINVALLFPFTPCIPKVPTLKLNFCFEEIKMNNITSWHTYMTKGSNFRCIRQFLLSQKSGRGELQILNTNPNLKFRFMLI